MGRVGRAGGGAPACGHLDVAQISSPLVASQANLETHQTGNSTAGGVEPGLMLRKLAPRPPEPNYPLPSRPAAPPGWGQPDAPEAGGPPLPRPQRHSAGQQPGTRQARWGAGRGSRSQDRPWVSGIGHRTSSFLHLGFPPCSGADVAVPGMSPGEQNGSATLPPSQVSCSAESTLLGSPNTHPVSLHLALATTATGSPRVPQALGAGSS